MDSRARNERESWKMPYKLLLPRSWNAIITGPLATHPKYVLSLAALSLSSLH